MLKLLTVAFGVAFAVSAHAQSMDERSDANSILGMKSSIQDFVTMAANGDMLEIETGKLAQQKSTDEKIKQFSQQLVTDHQKTSSELKSLIDSGKVKAQLPTGMDSAHQSKLDKLEGLSGTDFDRVFEDMQKSAHRDATSLFERYAKGGDNADLKAFAAKHLPTLQHHFKMVEDLSNSQSPTMGSGNR